MTEQVIQHYTESICYDLEQTAKTCKILASQIFEKSNIELSTEEFNVLDTILCHSGICQRDLAKLILRDRANTGRLLNTLEERGYVKRIADIKNNRVVRKVYITEKGENLWKVSSEKIKSILQACIKNIPEDEVEILRKSLQKFREQLLEIVEFQI